MGLIRLAMQRPVTIMVVVVAFVLASVLAISRMRVDIFPNLDLPVIYVVQPYGGLDPAQMEGYSVSFYEQHFFYITGVEHIESQSIQSAAVIKIIFRPGTDMASGMAQVVAQVERARSYMPPGTVTPFILRFDAGNVPVGYIVLSCANRTVGEIQDLAFVRVRPLVSTLEGVSMPPPFGGNQRTIVIHVNPERLVAYHLSPDEVVAAIMNGNPIMPSGVVRVGDFQMISRINSVVSDIHELLKLPLRKGPGPTVFLGDLGTIEDSTDIPTGYALVDGQRRIYMAISKQADASTVSVVQRVKDSIPKIQDILPSDIKVKFEFDQSIYVTQAISGLLFEGGMGAILTGLAVLVFLRDWRSALIVVLNIPFALLAAIVALWISGQTINIMTLGGLALAVGILVDEATVAIENIHTHLATGAPLHRAIYDAVCEVVTPRLLAMFSVLSVFMPSFFMVGSTRALFVPLSLAVGFAMIASYFLSNTFVPVASAWLLKAEHIHEPSPDDWMERIKGAYENLLASLMPLRYLIIPGYFVVAAVVIISIAPWLGQEIFPAGNPDAIQMRLKAPAGTRIEVTEELSKKALAIVSEDVGAANVTGTIGYVGTQPPMYAISNVYRWTSGPQEAVLLVALRHEANINVANLKERLRGQFAKELPDVSISFEAGDIINQLMNFGAPTPIQVDVNGPSFETDRDFTLTLLERFKKIKDLRDVTLVQPLNYPTINVQVDRERAGQFGVDLQDIGSAFVSGTYSSRFVTPIYWRDSHTGMAYQVQMDIPQSKMTSIKDVENIPVNNENKSPVYIRDVSKVTFGHMVGEYDHYNMRRQVSITANIAGDDLGRAAREVEAAIVEAGKRPKGVTVNIRGQVPMLHDSSISLSAGLACAVVVILLMLVAYFQSLPLSLIVVSVAPAIVAGVVVMLAVTGTTLNVESFMGAIMAIGVGVANSILVVVFEEHRRMAGRTAVEAAVEGAAGRLRPVMMTSMAMIAGMIPMALGLGDGGDRNAPLGRAVIGGLLASTSCVLTIVPMIFAIVQNKAGRRSASILPEDMEPAGVGGDSHGERK
jgi:multidrug efflux pump subunit AcrB